MVALHIVRMEVELAVWGVAFGAKQVFATGGLHCDTLIRLPMLRRTTWAVLMQRLNSVLVFCLRLVNSENMLQNNQHRPHDDGHEAITLVP